MRLDCRQRKAMLLTSVLRRQNADLQGAGVPSGTPPFNGARYLDTTTGVVYLGRNVLNFNNSYISTPTITGVRKVNLQFWHDEPNPSGTRVLHDGLNGDASSELIVVARNATTGTLSTVGTPGLSMIYDGGAIATNTVNPLENAWHTLTTDANTGRKLTRIGSNRSNILPYRGRIANIQVLGASDVLLANYAINEGTGTTIFDSSGNGQNGTLTLGSGSWELTWVPQN